MVTMVTTKATLRCSGCLLLLVLITATTAVSAFYIFDGQPNTFFKGDDISLDVNSLTSVHTLIPRDYYRASPFCQPDNGGPVLERQNLGQFLTGNRIYHSPYSIKTLEETRCRQLCQVTLTAEQADHLHLLIKNGYHHNWILDNLPSAHMAVVHDWTALKHFSGGFPIGIMDQDKTSAYIYNHVSIYVDYFRVDTGGDDAYRVVGFAVEPLSVAHQLENGNVVPCSSSFLTLRRNDIEKLQEVQLGASILFTYDVTWRESEVPWTSRWDVYFTEDHLVPDQVHWYSIVNSTLVIVGLSVVVTSILVKNLRKDVAASRGRGTTSDETEDEKGWKALHGDVFRPPSTWPMLLCVFVGTGIHLAITCLAVLCLGCLGLSPARRGSLLHAILVLYSISSSVSGYVSARLYMTLGGNDMRSCQWLTAILFPGIAFGVFLVLNGQLAAAQSTGAVPVSSILALAGLWVCVSMPLSCFGSKVAQSSSRSISFPTAVRDVARHIPAPTRLWRTPILSMMLVGLCPMATTYVELFFIMTGLWMNQFYYVFGFTMIVFIILVVTSSQVTVLAVYYRLKAENHQWWWQSFFWSGSVAFYILAYSVLWFRTLEASGGLAHLLYFGYMLLISLSAFLTFGSVGFVSSLLFVRRIYTVVNDTAEGYVELSDHEPSDTGDLALSETV